MKAVAEESIFWHAAQGSCVDGMLTQGRASASAGKQINQLLRQKYVASSGGKSAAFLEITVKECGHHSLNTTCVGRFLWDF